MGVEEPQDLEAELDSTDKLRVSYDEVEVANDEGLESDLDETLDDALFKLREFTAQAEAGKSQSSPLRTVPVTNSAVVEGFVRSLIISLKLGKTLDTFEKEWLELKATGQLEKAALSLPDAYEENLKLQEEIHRLQAELDENRRLAEHASSTWDKFRSERDFHKMHHKRVLQEKNKLIKDLARLKAHYLQYEPTIEELQHKYEVAMKEKMLVRLERDKIAARLEVMEAQTKALETHKVTAAGAADLQPQASTSQSHKTTKGGKRCAITGLPVSLPPNPFENITFPPANVKDFNLQKSFAGHLLPISNLAMHPTKPILITASDDKTWKMWHLPKGDLIMCGEGHQDWVAGVHVHPQGTHLASGSGDATVKLWSFEKQKCVATYTEHGQAVWGVAFHHTGDFLASCSLDHSVRLWDVAQSKCRQSLRGHVDSVNEVCWQPFSNTLCTASSDKTVSLWDPRSGLCVQTFYGHHNSCNAAAFNLAGSALASTDANGVLKLWDVRMAAELLTLDVSEHPANKCVFDNSGEVVAVASDSGEVVFCSTAGKGEVTRRMAGHDGPVQAVVFDRRGEFLVSAGADDAFKLWF